jgi:hypothetical protein
MSSPGPSLVVPRSKSRQAAQFAYQGAALREILGIEALGEPAVHGCEQVASLGSSVLVAPKPGEADHRAQLPDPGALLARNRKRPVEAGFGFIPVAPRQQQQQLAPEPVDLCLPAALVGLLQHVEGLGQGPEAALRVADLARNLGQNNEGVGDCLQVALRAEMGQAPLN